MTKRDNNLEAFFSLLRAGLWEKEVQLLTFECIDYSVIYNLAEEQTITGIIAAGLEHVTDIKVPKEDALSFIGIALQIEQRNIAMNAFLAELVEKMRAEGIYTLVVKGQGVAQCYERPLWRACGDIDFFLSKENYDKAKAFLIPIALHHDNEDRRRNHYSMVLDHWEIELHGTLYSEISDRVDRGLDKISKDIFFGGQVRSWMNGRTQVFLPSVDNDVIIIFTHILQHFYQGGVGLRQVCDWCRLLWSYRAIIDHKLLDRQLREMRIVSEWKAFSVIAVDYLGMPIDAMPLYDSSMRWRNKADKIILIILKTGNLGHNNDESYRIKYPFFIQKLVSMWRYIKEAMEHISIFPLNSLKMLYNNFRIGLKSTINTIKEGGNHR